MSSQYYNQQQYTPVSYNFTPGLKEELIEFVTCYQNRQFCEEIEFIEARNGDQWLQQALQTNFRSGLTGQDNNQREQFFGSNKRPAPKLRSYCQILCEALDDFTLKILTVAAIISIIVNMIIEKDHRDTAWIEGVAILCAVALSSNVQAINDYSRQKEFQKLNEVAAERNIVNVIRNEQAEECHVDYIVVGDIIRIYEGMEIPADGFLLEGYDLTLDESAMTGETDPLKKSTLSQCLDIREDIYRDNLRNTSDSHAVPSPALLSGTRVLTGEGLFVVIVVGENSCVGKIQALIQQEAEATPLQQKLETIATDIGKFGLVAAILTFIALIIRITITTLSDDKNFVDYSLPEIVRAFIIAITVVVVAIPEGLPLAVTISLAFSVKKMLADYNLVRQLQACETMGGANIICSDKTGTLTQNKMFLTTIWNNRFYEIDTNLEQYDVNQILPPNAQELIIQAINGNSSASLRPLTGSKTEIAGLEFTDKCGHYYEYYRDIHLTEGYHKFAFSSQRKRMTTIINNIDNDSPLRKRIHTKGASEIVLTACEYYFDWDQNAIVPITPEIREEMENAIYNMATRALRTLCIGFKEYYGDEDITTKDEKNVYEIEQYGFTCIALLGIMDVIRYEVPDAVEKCKIAGITVKMVTGDNKVTARAIALKCGITTEDPDRLILEGAEFNQMIGGVVCKKHRTKECPCARDKDTAKSLGVDVREDTILNGQVFDQICYKLDVLARSRPEDKYALVTGLMERDNVIAVTGDGTNDAPALKKANVGFAMGICGTQVAKEAADIILMDDNFSSIIKAVLWGRNIYDSIQKFLQFQLTVNVVAVVSIFLGAAAVKMAVLTAVQLLWVNLIMDTFGSLALATEPPSEKLLLRQPHSKHEYILTKKMVKHILCQAVFQIAIIMVMVFLGTEIFPEWKTSNNVLLGTKYGQRSDGTEYGLIFSGIEENYKDKGYVQTYGPSRHLTIVFNSFVWLQLINFFNARKINDEKFILEGFTKSSLFMLMIASITACQVLIVEFGNLPLNCHRNGLTIEQWFICIGIGLLGFFSSIIIRFIPEDKIFPSAGNKLSNPLADDSGVMNMKRNNEQKLQRRYSSLTTQYPPGYSKMASKYR